MKFDKFLILIIFFILLLGFATYWQFKGFQKTLSEVEFPSFKMPEIEIPLSQEGEQNKEFISPDGKLKLRYPSDWMEMTKESLGNLDQGTIKEGKALFFAQKFKIEKAAFALLIIQELEKKENIEKLIEGMKNAAKENGGEMEIISSDIKENEGYFEAKYKRESSVFLSKERVIPGENKFYLISIFSLEKDWLEFKNEVDEVLNSAQFIP